MFIPCTTREWIVFTSWTHTIHKIIDHIGWLGNSKSCSCLLLLWSNLIIHVLTLLHCHISCLLLLLRGHLIVHVLTLVNRHIGSLLLLLGIHLRCNSTTHSHCIRSLIVTTTNKLVHEIVFSHIYCLKCIFWKIWNTFLTILLLYMTIWITGCWWINVKVEVEPTLDTWFLLLGFIFLLWLTKEVEATSEVVVRVSIWLSERIKSWLLAVLSKRVGIWRLSIRISCLFWDLWRNSILVIIVRGILIWIPINFIPIALRSIILFLWINTASIVIVVGIIYWWVIILFILWSLPLFILIIIGICPILIIIVIFMLILIILIIVIIIIICLIIIVLFMWIQIVFLRFWVILILILSIIILIIIIGISVFLFSFINHFHFVI